MWLELLKNYDVSVVHHSRKENVVAYALSHMPIGSLSHVEESKKYLVKDVHRFSRLGLD